MSKGRGERLQAVTETEIKRATVEGCVGIWRLVEV